MVLTDDVCAHSLDNCSAKTRIVKMAKSKKKGSSTSTQRKAKPSNEPIHKLPDDVLATIFSEAQEPWDDPCYRVILVCRRWNNIARETPMLWEKLEVKEEPRLTVMETALRNSASNPIDISFCKTAEVSESLSLLTPHISRIRSLRATEMENVADDALSEFLRERMPLCKTWSSSSLRRCRMTGSTPVSWTSTRHRTRTGNASVGAPNPANSPHSSDSLSAARSRSSALCLCSPLCDN